MATTVQIKNIEYPKYAEICYTIDEAAPWALLRDKYHSDQKMAIFQFHDVRYVPAWLKDYMIVPKAPSYKDVII